MKKYYKPPVGLCLGEPFSNLLEYLEEKGTDGILKRKPLAEVLADFKTFDLTNVSAKVYSQFGYEFVENISVQVKGFRHIVKKQCLNGDWKRYAVYSIGPALKPGRMSMSQIEVSNEDADLLVKVSELMREQDNIDGFLLFVYGSVPAPLNTASKKIPDSILVNLNEMKVIGKKFSEQQNLEDDGFWEELYNMHKLAKGIEEESDSGEQRTIRRNRNLMDKI